MKYLLIALLFGQFFACSPDEAFRCEDTDGDGDCCTVHRQPIDCNDSIPCTNDFCVNGYCFNVPVNCDDGVSCTQDWCNPKAGYCDYIDTCHASPCTFDTIPDPVYGNDYCKVIVCVNGNMYNTVRSCNDGNLCTNDFCAGEQCHNAPVNCDDGTDCVNTGMCWCDMATGNCVYYN